jgi:hypothetical protein
MKNTILPALALAALAACSSSTSSGNGSGGAGTTTATQGTTTSSSTHMNQCVLTTDKGNENGVGAYCTPGGGECSKFPMAGLCLADVGQDEWFCTRIGCQMTSECGTDATCVMETGGSACVPNKCLDGTDAGTD